MSPESPQDKLNYWSFTPSAWIGFLGAALLWGYNFYSKHVHHDYDFIPLFIVMILCPSIAVIYEKYFYKKRLVNYIVIVSDNMVGFSLGMSIYFGLSYFSSIIFR